MSGNKIHRVVIAASILGAAHASVAGVATWTGSGTTSWTDPINWGGTAPLAGDSLVFDGNTTATNINDFVAGTNFAGITWNNTGSTSWSHTGNSINLSGNLNYARTSLAATTTTPFVLQTNINVDVASGGTLNTNGVISGGFSITKTGAGLWANGIAQTFSGGLNVNGGTFRTTVSGNTTASIGTGTVSINNGAVVELRATTATTFNNALVVGTGGGKIDQRSNHTFNPSSITGTGDLTLRPTGATNLVFTIVDMKNWAGTLIGDRNGQTSFGLRLGNSYVNNSAINVALVLNDGVFLSRQNGTNLTNTVTDIGSLSSAFANTTLGGSAAGAGYFTYSIGSLGTNTTFAGNIINGSTASALRKVGAGELILAGTANNYSGPTSVFGGKLTLANLGVISATSSITVGDLANPGTAATLRNDGTLTVGVTGITVNSNGTLQGKGTIAGNTTVNGTLSPGNASVAKLSWTSGNLTLGDGATGGSGATTVLELPGSVSGTPGTAYDNVALTTGNLVYDGTLNLDFTGATLAVGTYDLFTFTGTATGGLDAINVLGTTGSLSGNFASTSWSGSIGSFSAVFTLGSGDLVLSLAVVPEPLTAAGVVLLASRVLGRRSRTSL